MKNKLSGIVFLFGSVYYLISEFISAIYFNDLLANTYIYHTISELGIPNYNSPLFFLMNSAFILIGLTVLIGNFSNLKKHIVKNNNLFYILTFITAIGVIIVGLIHGGNPLTSGYHTLGAIMAILGGNILLIITSKSMDNFEIYHKITFVLGIFGVLVFWIMCLNINNVYMPVFERLSVYTLIIWNLMTGIYLYNKD